MSLPVIMRGGPSLVVQRIRALLRLRDGKLDQDTLTMFRSLWRRSGGSYDLFALLLCERELGGVLSTAYRDALWQACESAQGEMLRRAALFALEAEEGGMLSGRLDDLAALRSDNPPILAFLADAGIPPSPDQAMLVELHNTQRACREAFTDWWRSVVGSACVVGNAAHLRGSGLGAKIDAHAGVVRFNGFGQDADAHHDVGGRLDVWVCNFDYLEGRGRLDRTPPTWLILSGADALYRWRSWGIVRQVLAQGCRVVTVPRRIYGALSRKLQAPPSAGILTLQWLAGLQGGLQGVSAAGFQADAPADSGRYHYHSPLRFAGRRHNWPAERRLLGEFADLGLLFLDRIPATDQSQRC